MKALKIAAAVVVVLIGAVTVFLLTFDANQYRGVIQAQATAATGREVSIGEISLELSLSPAIVVGNVRLGNAPWGSRPDMVIAERIAAHTQLIPLIFGTVNIADLEIIGGDVLLETNAEGKGNWEFDVPPSEGEAVPLNVDGISAVNLKFSYRDAAGKMRADLSAGALAVEIAGALMEMNIPSVTLDGATLAYAQDNTSAEAVIGALSLKTAGAITDLHITDVSVSDSKASYADGATSGKAAISALSMKANGPLTGFNITDVSISDSSASYTTDGAPLDVTVSALSLDDGGVLELVGQVSGQDVRANGQIASLAKIMAGTAPFPVKLALEGFGLKADTDLMVNLSGDRPSASGTVSIPEIAVPDAAGTGAGTGGTQAGGKVFPATPLPWDTLATANSDVKLSIAKVTLSNGMEISNIVAPVKLSNGVLSIDPFSLAVADGTLDGALTMTAAQKMLSLKATAKNFTAESVAKAMRKTDLITGGPVDLALDVRGSGDTVRAVMDNLSGSLVGGVGESRVRSDALNIIGADVIMQVASIINPVGNKDPYTLARCMVVNFQIADGIARTEDGIAFVTDKMQVTSSGQIDLGTEQVNLNVRPKASSGLGVGLGNLVQAVKVSGPLSGPGVGIDKAGAAKTIGSIGAAIATGGLSALVQGAKDRVDTSNSDPCGDARTWHVK